MHAHSVYNAAWQKVLVVLEEFFKDIRENRLNYELRKTLKVRFDALEEAITAHYVTLPRTARMDCRPQYIDFALTPECRAIADVPTSQTVTADDFAPIIPALAQTWDADRRQELTEYLLPHLGDIAAVDPLELAISFFNRPAKIAGRFQPCLGDISTMRYPAILNHHCLTGPSAGCYRGSSYSVDEFLKEDVYTRTTKTLGHYADYESMLLEAAEDTPCLRTHVPFKLNRDGDGLHPGDVIARMRRIVSMVGLDPARATYGDLERCDAWFRCISCETEHDREPIFARSWSGVVSPVAGDSTINAGSYNVNALQYDHELEHINASGRLKYILHSTELPQWLRADSDDEVMSRVRAYQEAKLRETDFGICLWSCSLCRTFNAASQYIAEHLDEM